LAKSKENIGLCRLCGLNKKLTFEHIPPKKAFNSEPLFVQKYEHLFDRMSYVYGKKGMSNRGNGGYTLCKKCNNNTGGDYAKDFIEFVFQGMEILKFERKPMEIVSFDLKIKPLNVIKQILTMFLSADSSMTVLNIPKMKEFILNKKSKDFPKNIKILMYCNCSPSKRIIGYTFGNLPSFNGISHLSEINFEPFGYILGIDKVSPQIPFYDITSFLNFEYDEDVKINIQLPYLKVNSPIIGHYSS